MNHRVRWARSRRPDLLRSHRIAADPGVRVTRMALGGRAVSLFKKPEIEEIHAFLREHKALIVHFSGTPPSGSGKLGALRVTVRPNDQMRPPVSDYSYVADRMPV